MPRPDRFTDKVAIVTGGGNGIGEAICKAFAAEGAKVIVADVVAKGAERVANEIKAAGGKAIASVCDVSKEDDVDNMVQCAVENFGTVDILVNNAGINPFCPFIVLQDDDWQRTIDVNLTGAYRCAKAVMPIMTEKMYGKIVNVTSIMSIIAGKGQTAYNASKGGMKMLTQGMCVDLAEYGINVNAVGPGMVVTGLTKDLFNNEQRKKWFLDKIPAKKIGQPEDIAPAVLFLASDEAAYIHGETIFVDGGMLSCR